MTNYFSFQHFRKMNVRFMLLKKIPLCMKLSVIMLFICVGLAYASDSYSQNVLLNIDVNNKSVQEVLDEIEKQSKKNNNRWKKKRNQDRKKENERKGSKKKKGFYHPIIVLSPFSRAFYVFFLFYVGVGAGCFLLDPFFFRKNALKNVSRSARSSFSVHEWLENVAQIMPSFFSPIS